MNITLLPAKVTAERSSWRRNLVAKHDRPYDRNNGERLHTRSYLELPEENSLVQESCHKFKPHDHEILDQSTDVCSHQGL
jgi:hypothetical protein